MTTKKAGSLSPDLVNAVHEAKSKLENKHYEWIITAALEHFVNELVREEQLLIRLTTFSGTAYRGPLKQDRAEAIRDAKAEREQYIDIIEFLHALREAHMHASAEQFAEDLIASGAFRRRT